VKKFLGKTSGFFAFDYLFHMTNYRQFYNAWQGFAKPKRELLLEEISISAKISPDDFLALTTDAEELKQIMDKPSVQTPFDPNYGDSKFVAQLVVNLDNNGNAFVSSHDGRNRSYSAKLAGLQQVPLLIKILNKDKAGFKDIKQLIGEFNKSVKIPIEQLTAHQEVESDPIGIGESVTVKGYFIVDGFETRGIQPLLKKAYLSNSKFSTVDYGVYAQTINDAYTITDDSGKQYVVEKTLEFPDLSRRTSKNQFNLSPHPVKEYGNIEMANEKNYTIKKKT
jgi:hypothetical protein